VAEAIDGRCSVCNMAMRLQYWQDLKKGDQILSCESCQRILYYNPPASLEDLAGEAAPAVQE
jgi:predicted  nucleic acid-binding Zn-ribbon protein